MPTERIHHPCIHLEPTRHVGHESFNNMDSPQAPLISDTNREDDGHDEADHGLLQEADDVVKPTAPEPGLFVLLLTVAAGLGGLLFGCECCLDSHFLR
jgi:hypothetical protein